MKIVNAQYIVVKISKNEYFHSLVPYKANAKLSRVALAESDGAWG